MCEGYIFYLKLLVFYKSVYLIMYEHYWVVSFLSNIMINSSWKYSVYSRAIRARPPDNAPHPSVSGMTKAIPPSRRVRIDWKQQFLPRLAPWPLAICPRFGRKNFQVTPGMPDGQSFGARMNICARRGPWIFFVTPCPVYHLSLDEYLHQTRFPKW